MGLGSPFQSSLGKRKQCNDDPDDEEVVPVKRFQASSLKSHNPEGEDPIEYTAPRNRNHRSDDEESSSSLSDESDEEDDSKGDEGLTGECSYEECEEAYPECVAFDKDFAQVGNDLISIPKAAMDIISKGNCDSKRVENCRSNAEEIATIPRPKREKICLLGNTGAGMYYEALLSWPLLRSFRQELFVELTSWSTGVGEGGT